MNNVDSLQESQSKDIALKKDLLLKELGFKQAIGEITLFMADVSLSLSDDESVKFDFQVFSIDGKVTFFSSVDSYISREKKEKIESTYPVTIKEF